ncbi:hypothetical protein D3C73_1450020 [compost metagenome]
MGFAKQIIITLETVVPMTTPINPTFVIRAIEITIFIKPSRIGIKMSPNSPEAFLIISNDTRLMSTNKLKHNR